MRRTLCFSLLAAVIGAILTGPSPASAAPRSTAGRCSLQPHSVADADGATCLGQPVSKPNTLLW